MNVNLTPSVETSKVTNVTKSASTQSLVSGESGESKGFLDRLASLLIGKSNAVTGSESSDASKESKTVNDSEVETTSTDELLSQGNDVAAQSDSDDETAEISGSLKQFVKSDEPEHTDLDEKMAKAMNDGDEILGRLQEANQTLVKNDGKALPHEESEESQLEHLDVIQPYVQNKEASTSTSSASIQWGNTNAEKMGVTAESLTTGGNKAANGTDGKEQPKTEVQLLAPQTMMSQADKTMMAQSQMPQHAESQAQLQPVINAQTNPLLAGVMANQADPVGNQAALKAGLGAKALNSLLEGNKRTEGATDTHFAQQLSAAAGQQGLNNPQSLRSDSLQSTQQNMPLQLSRGDMAAEQMAERVQVMLSKNLKNIDIRLDPPELGRLHIRMNMNGDGATVHFTVANQQARDALEQSMPRLREMLNNQGVQLGDTSVQQQSSGQQQRYAASGDGSGGQSASGDQHQSEENLDTNVKLDLNVAAKRDGISYYA
uniref:Flagellar hook-length control protein-like C-terminal domain-containing protein n=1 Tax=Vibrio ziniensis TaxID=2711221 RepID=A0A6G7CMG4_9VIBR|nr:hypothetical protein G5S32_10590 [Vibrio ziniensis]